MATLIAAGIGAAGAAAGGWLSSRGGGGGGPSGTALWMADQAQKRYEERLDAGVDQATELLKGAIWQTEKAEQGKYNIWRGLGAGYKAPTTTSYMPEGARTTIITKKGKTKTKNKPSWIQRKEFGDFQISAVKPVEYAEDVLGSPQGGLADRLTQEAIQLVERSGPLWDEFKNSVFGAVTDQVAAASRAMGEEMRGMIAKGGDARNMAQNMAIKMRGQVELNRASMQNLREGMMQLNVWARDNAKSQLAFNQLWVNGLPLTNSGYVSAMNGLMSTYATSILPQIAGAAGTSLQASMNTAGYIAANQKDETNMNGTWGNLVSGLSSIAAGGVLSRWGGSTANKEMGQKLVGQGLQSMVP